MEAPADPVAFFLEVRERAEAKEPWQAASSALATADAQGRPSVRFVLVKDVGPDGFWFYTNDQSRKGRELAENPWAALAFHWDTEQLQIRVEGPVERAPAARSDVYFAARPRISQLGAWASEQSRPVTSRDELLARVKELEARFAGIDVPRPPHWGGYRLEPRAIEIWREGEFRLHDRFRYERGSVGEAWRVTRLCP